MHCPRLCSRTQAQKEMESLCLRAETAESSLTSREAKSDADSARFATERETTCKGYEETVQSLRDELEIAKMEVGNLKEEIRAVGNLAKREMGEMEVEVLAAVSGVFEGRTVLKSGEFREGKAGEAHR